MKSLVVLSLTLAVVSCRTTAEHMDAHPEMPMATLVVEAESLVVKIPVEGTVTARRSAELSTRMMARISSVAVDVGAPVRVGQVLVRLGNEDVAAKRVSAEAAVDAARAAREEAARQAARMDTLYAQDAVPLVQRDGAQLALTQVTAQLAMARAALQEVEAAETYATIRAPFDGFVVARHVDPGDLAHPGVPILVVEGSGARDAVLAVPAEIANRVQRGDSVDIQTHDGRAITAPIRAIAAGADPRSRTVQVLVALPADWPTGIAVTGLMPGGVRASAVIPATAVVHRGQLTGVRVASHDGVTLRWVRLGRTIAPVRERPARVEVLSGLSAGERITP
jgi:membrane fusion protein, multidrug efflux system